MYWYITSPVGLKKEQKRSKLLVTFLASLGLLQFKVSVQRCWLPNCLLKSDHGIHWSVLFMAAVISFKVLTRMIFMSADRNENGRYPGWLLCPQTPVCGGWCQSGVGYLDFQEWRKEGKSVNHVAYSLQSTVTLYGFTKWRDVSLHT